jgi:hypothetical protein
MKIANSNSTLKKIKYDSEINHLEYEIVKCLANLELKRQQKGIDEEVARHGRLDVLANTSTIASLSNYMLGGDKKKIENESLLIDEYWSSNSVSMKYKGLSKLQIKGLLVLQNTFRTWIILKKYRDTIKNEASEASRSFISDKSLATVLYIQSSVRRTLAKLSLEAKIKENSIRDNTFAIFCSKIKKGVDVTMFSRKYGTSPTRTISFDKGFNNLTFTTSLGTKRNVDLTRIHKIHTGKSNTMYPQSKQPNLSRCICIECLGERVLDLECEDAKQARDLFNGFTRLQLLLAGKAAPFFIDNFGIPRRAGPSIIKNAIGEVETDEDVTKKLYRSEADEMRFWSAVRFLQQEYDGWQNDKDNERQAHDVHNEKEAGIREKRSQLSNEKAKMISEQAETKGKKMTKLVRFIDADGKTRLIEEKDAHFPPLPSYDEYDTKSNEENEIKRENKKSNSLGSIESNQPIPMKSSLKGSMSSSDNNTIKKKSELIKNMDRSAAILQSLDNSDEMSVQSLKSTLSRRSNASSVWSSLTKVSLRYICVCSYDTYL